MQVWVPELRRSGGRGSQLLLRPRGRLDDDTGGERHGARAGIHVYIYYI